MKQLPKATALVALDGTVVDASDSWLDVFGVNPKDCSEVNIFHLYGESGLLKQKLQESKSFSFRHGIENKMEENWFESTFAPWFDEKENVIGSIIQTDDISREVEKEMELEKTNNILKIKSEVSQVGCWEYTLATEELFWCDETKKIHNVPLSYKPNVADAIAFYKQGYSRNKISMLFHSAINEGTPFNKKLTIITQNGQEKWVSATGKPIRENGKIVKLLGTFQDINEQVTSETRIKHHQQLLTALIDNLPLNVFVKDLDSRKILVNKAECDYLGKSTKELIGKTDFDLYEKEVAKISREEDLEVIRTLKPMLGKETINIKKDGKITNFLTSKIPLFDLEGKISGLIGIGMDITAMKKKEDQLRNLINITSVQNKKLINFAHIVSHNLRSHSANFSMLLKFLSEEQNEAEKAHIMNMLNQASDSLLETLENLNQVVDINTNVTLSKQPLNLNESIDKVRKNLSAFLEKNKVKIINNIPQDMIVWSVPAYLDSIILNLVTNAVKYSSPERSPVITMDAKKRDKTLIFSVSDNGLGIDLERYGDKIFGMYKTFHNRKDAKGIGPYIIKNQIEAMGGSITVNSEVDKGATFNVYFNEESK
ncbi:PAS domain-containing protein [Muricauda sp. SK9]|uniref:PAS domain-containing sensor histidine kinase n=1 Tax=Flavobacteriaceae TaxID=49546 RepID=UPI00234AED86|nr:PAS domain-containing protein [Muricauda sp. SK9]MDC6384396.1 PAS domain-containing protein [Muricauda sp. SK9]